MNKRQTEYITLYLFVFGAILLFGVLARKFVLVKGMMSSVQLLDSSQRWLCCRHSISVCK